MVLVRTLLLPIVVLLVVLVVVGTVVDVRIVVVVAIRRRRGRALGVAGASRRRCRNTVSFLRLLRRTVPRILLFLFAVVAVVGIVVVVQVVVVRAQRWRRTSREPLRRQLRLRFLLLRRLRRRSRRAVGLRLSLWGGSVPHRGRHGVGRAPGRWGVLRRRRHGRRWLRPGRRHSDGTLAAAAVAGAARRRRNVLLLAAAVKVGSSSSSSSSIIGSRGCHVRRRRRGCHSCLVGHGLGFPRRLRVAVGWFWLHRWFRHTALARLGLRVVGRISLLVTATTTVGFTVALVRSRIPRRWTTTRHHGSEGGGGGCDRGGGGGGRDHHRLGRWVVVVGNKCNARFPRAPFFAIASRSHDDDDEDDRVRS